MEKPCTDLLLLHQAPLLNRRIIIIRINMKKLQNNFTTPEQSKRLLEIGVPADSADLYYQDYGSIPMVVWTLTQPRDLRRGFLKPCWSVGRLIEIFSKCYTGAKCYYSSRNLHKTEFWIERFDRLSKIGFIDFSKLEE